MASGLLTELVDGTIIEYNKEIFCRPKKVFLYENQKTPIRKGFFESNKVSRLLPVTNHVPVQLLANYNLISISLKKAFLWEGRNLQGKSTFRS